jgi:hypothetical protein
MSGGTTVQTSTTDPWKGQQKYLRKGFRGAEELLKGGLPEYYQGETLAGFDPAQTAAQQATLGYTMGPRVAGMQQGAESQLGKTYGLANQIGAQGLAAGQYGSGMARPMSQQEFSALTPFDQQQYTNMMAGNVDLGPTSPFASTANALQQQVMGQLQGNILPGLRQQQIQYQPGGSSRGALAQNKAIAGAVQQGLTKPLADMYSQAYQTAQAQRLPAAQMGLGAQQYGMGYGLQGLGTAQGGGQLGLGGMAQYPTIMGAPLGMYNAMGAVGDTRRGMTQSAIDQDMQRYNYEQMAPQNALNQYMNTISGNYGGQTTQTTPRNNSGIMNMLGSLGSAAILASDVRVKENLVRDGTIKGHPAYKFNYVGDDTPRRGVIAQEVEQTNPAAVAEFGGIKHVNYGAL